MEKLSKNTLWLWLVDSYYRYMLCNGNPNTDPNANSNLSAFLWWYAPVQHTGTFFMPHVYLWMTKDQLAYYCSEWSMWQPDAIQQ